MEELSQFDMLVMHRPGKYHINADALSRIPDPLEYCPNYRKWDASERAEAIQELQAPLLENTGGIVIGEIGIDLLLNECNSTFEGQQVKTAHTLCSKALLDAMSAKYTSGW